MPFRGRVRVTSPFGWRMLNGAKDFHNGVDLVGVDGTDIVSPLDGTVIMAGYGTECGNQMQVYTRFGRTLFFCHMKTLCAKRGETVIQGQKLGVMGATGTKCFGAHLHFGVYEGKGRSGKVLDAEKFLNLK